MAPYQHIRWFAENIEWFEHLTSGQLDIDVPSCPGWTVLNVVNHLSDGLALAYPIAMGKAPDTDAELAFDGVPWPAEHATSLDALTAFSTNMTHCKRRFEETHPNTPCWTYSGAGTAAFWFRRAAIETTLHRMDVAEALSESVEHLDHEQAADAIEETLSFALPLAGSWTNMPNGHLWVESNCFVTPISTGTAGPEATITGEPHDVLNALWGRHRDRVTITGDDSVARDWLSLIEVAFAGR